MPAATATMRILSAVVICCNAWVLSPFVEPPQVTYMSSWNQSTEQFTAADQSMHYIWFDTVPSDAEYDTWIHNAHTLKCDSVDK